MFKQIIFAALLLPHYCLAQSTIILKEENVENAYPRLSKDGKSILYQSNRTGNWQIYTCDMKGRSLKNITGKSHNNNFPDWSPDNNWVAFVSDRDGNEEIYLVKTDGTGLKRVTNNTARDIHPYFSPDGKYLLFNSDRKGGQFDVYRYRIADGKTEQITDTKANETCARYAPDMKQMVLLRNDEVEDNIYTLTDAVSKNISNTPNVYHGWPVYSYDGKWIYYSSMEKGTYSIFRIKPDGKEKEQVTNAAKGEEHARVNISRDGKMIVYNIRSENMIYIVSRRLA